MKTYILNLYYPKLETFTSNVSMAKDFVEKISGKDGYRVLRAGGNICTLSFATNADPKNFEKELRDIGESQFQYLLLEVSAVHAGWTDKSVYQWLQDRLRKDSGKQP